MAACCNPVSAEAIAGDEAAQDRVAAKSWLRMGFAALIAAQSMIFGLAINESPPIGQERLMLHGFLAGSAVLVFLLAGLPLLKQSWASLRQGRIGIEHMFLLGIFGAFFSSLYSTLTGIGVVYYEVVAVLVAIYTLGSLVTVNRKQAALKAADSLRQEFSRCLRLSCGGKQEDVAVTAIEKGDRIIVLAGQGIPVDGVIVEGSAFVQETALTGEPFPIVKQLGDRVLAGSHVLDERLIITASSAGLNRQLDQLLNVITAARVKSSGIQKQADRIIRWFLPSVMVLSVVTFAFWAGRGQWEIGLFNSLAVLVVACPCAMGLATPIGIWNALNVLARRGLAVHSGDLIEKLAQVDTVIFDKTGTLSEESLQLVDWVVADGQSRKAVQDWLANVQSHSTHPVARAFQQAFQHVTYSSVLSDLKIIPGAGVEADVKDATGTRHLRLGNVSVFSMEQDFTKEIKNLHKKLRASSDSAMELWVLADGQPVALALLREKLRDSGQAALVALKRMGLRVEIMSGDRPERLVALGFPLAQAGLLPEEKALRIERYQNDGARVLFVGDGVNDAPAMSVALASIALSSGAEITQHTAQAKLYGGDLMMIPSALALSQKVSSGIKRNLLFAACYNMIGITLAMTGILHPVAAVLLMLASSLTVTWRALRFGGNLEKVLAESMNSAEQRRLTRAKPKPSLKTILSQTQLFDWLIGVGLFLQAFWVINAAELRGFMAGSVMAIFLVASFGAVSLSMLWKNKPQLKLMVSMLALGNLGMLIGWSADVGFKPVIEHGVCVCDCALSHMGMGKLWSPSWMQAGMILTSLPLAWGTNIFQSQKFIHWKNSAWMHSLVCLVGMLAGMWVSEALLLLIMWTNPLLHLAATYAAMSLGMLLGMTFFCRTYLTLVLSGERKS